MRVLFASSELAPLVQSGGLGDAVSGLARALGARGHDVTCVIPGYRDAFLSRSRPPVGDAGEVRIGLPETELVGRWKVGELFRGVDVALLDLPALYNRPGLYGVGDTALRFIAFSRAVAYATEKMRPDVLVAHDWHAALAIAILRTSLDRGLNRRVGTALVVHNNAHQGRMPISDFRLSGLPAELLHPDGAEAWGTFCTLKAGMMWADRIVAVSPSYAREVCSPSFGEGLEGAYRSRAHRLTGIANGIDTARFDPTCDRVLRRPFSAADLTGKALARKTVLQGLGLREPPPGLFLVAVGRLAAQKGWDVLARAIPALVHMGASIAVVGDGDPAIARQLKAAAARFPRRVNVALGFDDGYARRLYAGGDAILIPSRFEPCGLVQLIGQRYGTVPIAHAVGGLNDTIVDPRRGSRAIGDERVDAMTGVLFEPLGIDPLLQGVARVAAIGQKGQLPELQRRLLSLDVSWEQPAARWERLLLEVAKEARARY